MLSDHYDDNNVFEQWLQVTEAEEDTQREEENKIWHVILGAALIFYGSEELRRIRNDRRREYRLYLTRAEILPNPRLKTPWESLYSSQSNRAFVTTMCFNVASFEYILDAGFRDMWHTIPIPRNDVSPEATPRITRRSLDAAGCLGLILHHLSSTMSQTSLVQIFAIIPSSVSRYLSFSLGILLRTLRKMEEGQVRWLRGDEFEERNALVVNRHPLLTGAFGIMDGLKLPVQTSSDEEVENATYNGWLQEHFVSCVLVFCPRGEIIACRLNCPGSWHDSRVASAIYEKLLRETPEGYYLVADTAFPRGTRQILNRIRAPTKAGDTLPLSLHARCELEAFDRQLLSFRQAAEWGMRAFQGSFGRLRLPLSIDFADARGDLLETCVRLFNLRTRCVGYNEIRTVYLPQWEEEDEYQTWKDFETISFKDQMDSDRVHRFHLQYHN